MACMLIRENTLYQPPATSVQQYKTGNSFPTSPLGFHPRLALHDLRQAPARATRGTRVAPISRHAKQRHHVREGGLGR
eukprot:3668235-Rhodomonas_salina.1